ncbi:MAG: hypothetical protein KDC34_08480 [Saprospiraceae bacterium]|nr:hypothetical protein [Saprospiraceae bacterium]
MKRITVTLFLMLGFLFLQTPEVQAQNYSGVYPRVEFFRHNGYDPVYGKVTVAQGDTLAFIRFRGHVNSGIWHTGTEITSWITSPVTDIGFESNLVFRTDSTSRMSILHNGNVGVNTVTPQQLFTVSHSSLPVIRFDRSNAGERDFELYNGTDGNLFFRGGLDGVGAALSNFMVINYLGRVGIGTDNPDQLLTLSNAEPVLRLERNGAGESDYELYNGANGNLYFRGGADGTGGALSNFVVFDNAGLVGIGTEAPDQLLTLSAPDNPVLRLDRSTGGEFDMELSLQTDGDLYFRGGLDDTGANLNDLMLLTNTGKLAIGTLNTPTSLGASDLTNYTIFAAGGILTEEIRVRTGWADYVFDPGYQRLNLENVESYIEENGKLPNMPSSAEVEANGLELGDITVKQQEKIEELFLYMIEMDKELDALRAENENLRKRVEELEQ